MTRRYFRDNDLKHMSFENTTSSCTHLVMAKLIPLVQDLEAWKHRIREMAKGNHHGQYVVKGVGSQTDISNISLFVFSKALAWVMSGFSM